MESGSGPRVAGELGPRSKPHSSKERTVELGLPRLGVFHVRVERRPDVMGVREAIGMALLALRAIHNAEEELCDVRRAQMDGVSIRHLHTQQRR